MQAALAYYDAQREYTRADQDMDGVPDYAQKIASAPGRHDGLYWPGQGYHGYLFKILNAQAPSAPRGAYDYVINSRMRSGFALVAWPPALRQNGCDNLHRQPSGRGVRDGPRPAHRRHRAGHEALRSGRLDKSDRARGLKDRTARRPTLVG